MAYTEEQVAADPMGKMLLEQTPPAGMSQEEWRALVTQSYEPGAYSFISTVLPRISAGIKASREPAAVGADVEAKFTERERDLLRQAGAQKILEKQREADTSRYMGGLEQVQQAGLGSLQAQQALVGLLGPEAQQAAIAQLEASPQFQSLVAQGEAGILANAAATGGVRGGNTQAALAQFRPGLLSSIIEQQYARLGGLSGMGAQAGQSLMTGGISREQSEQDYMRWLQGTATELGVAGLQAGAQGRLGQTQLDLQRQALEQDAKMASEAQSQQDLASIGSGALTGAGKGAAIGASLGGPAAPLTALAGAGIGAAAGGLFGGLPALGRLI